MRVTMDEQGRIEIPREIREAAGLALETTLELTVRHGKIEISVAEPEPEPARGLTLVQGAATGAVAAVARARPDRPQLDLLIRMAIAHRRLVQLVYKGQQRLVEPHDYGLRNNEAQLLVFQKSGGSSVGWRSLKLAEMSDFQVLETTFPGGRPAGEHIAWDVLYARVAEPEK
jgi:bifunctional DNA-binding transcriptional regulator/antitoxin component of YhaV-PrlF toxin-antitoxin module